MTSPRMNATATAFLARLVVEGRISIDDDAETIADLADHLPKRVFRLES